MKSWHVIACGVVIAMTWRNAAAQSRQAGLAWQVTHVDNGSPSISPEGTRMVYVSVIAGVGQIFLARLDGTHIVQLTSDTIDHNNPIWSPDGKRIAYSSDDGEHEAIYVLNADGSGLERVSPDDGQRYIHPSWSSDGTRIIYCSTDDLHPPLKNASNVYSIDLKTRQVKTLVTGGTNTYPALSPDGRRIAFRKIIGDPINSEVFVANVDGSDQHNLTNNPAYDGWPAWSPDGSQIAFASNREGNHRIYLMNADGSNVRALAATEGRATEPHWTPDGKRVYFSNCWSVAYGRDCQILAADASPQNP